MDRPIGPCHRPVLVTMVRPPDSTPFTTLILGNDGMMAYSDVMTSLVRIQIQLTESQADFLKTLSTQEGRSVADLVREAVDGLMREDHGLDVEARRARALAVAGQFHSCHSDIATEHDRYLADAIET